MVMNRKNRKYSGITMMESVIYLGMFALLFLTLMQFYFSIGNSNQRASATLKIQRSEIFLSQHIEDIIRKSDSYNSINSITGVDLSTIRFNYGAGYKEYYVDEGILYLDDGTNIYQISPSDLEIAKFRADVIQDSELSIYRIDLTIEIRDPDIPTHVKTKDLFFIKP